MRTGKSITDLAKELQDIRHNSKDYVVPPNKLGNVRAEVGKYTIEEIIAATETKVPTHDELMLSITNGETKRFRPTSWAHNQLSDYAEIPKAYYDRLRGENANLLATNLNHGFSMAAGLAASKKGASGRMIRTHRGNLRAFLSSRYRPLDNFDLFEAIAPALIDLGFEPESCELTDKRLYIKCVTPKVEGEVKPGDVVQYGLVVSGSDVGSGSVRVEPLLMRLICRNGLISNAAMRQQHVGKNLAGDDIEHLLSDSTREMTDRAFWNQVRDVVTNFAKPEYFERELDRLRQAADQPLKVFDLPEVVERTLKATAVYTSEKAKASIIENLASGAHGAGLNKWGLANAFTFAAQELTLDYDAATDLERAGNKVLELTPRQWEGVNAK